MFKLHGKKHIALRWVLLTLISTSVTVTTFHMHHHIQWNHPDSHSTAAHNISRNTSYCPYGGYLFGAKLIQAPPHLADIYVVAHIVLLSKTQQVDPFYGEYTGRSPPMG